MGKCKMVASGRKCPPHFFWGYTNGRYECDSNCPQWSSAKIFSHTVAAVEYNQELPKFVKWYEKNNKSLNMMALVTHNVSNAGRKETAEIPNTTQIPKWLSNIPNSASLSQTVPLQHCIQMAPQLPPAGGLVLAWRIHECEQQQSSPMHLEAFSYLATSDKSIKNNRACVIQAQH